MRMHQPPGANAPREKVEDWSWHTTRRRLGVLWRLTKPYRLRTFFSVFSLLTATAAALAPPFLAKYALADGLHGDVGSTLWLVVAKLLSVGAPAVLK